MSITDFTQYQPPGVYIEEGQTPLVSVIGVSPNTVAIVGPSVGYRIFTEAVTLNGTTPVLLSKTGIDLAHFTVAQADGTVITSSNYATSVGAGPDSNSGTTADNTTTLTRNGTGIADGATVYVTYRYTDTDYFSPVRVTVYEDVKDFFGEPLNNTTGAIISPLSLAAKLAIENGASQLLLVATAGDATSTTRTQLQDGLAKLSGLYDVSVVVILPVGISGSNGAPGDVLNVVQDLTTHVENCSDDGYYRTGIVGVEQNNTINALSVAAAASSKRVVSAYPNQLTYYNGLANQNLNISGYYLAAAYAGKIVGQKSQEPLTKKQITGISGIPSSILNTMTTTFKNSLSDGGIAVSEIDRSGRLVVRHGTTTDRTSVTTRELSLVRARDTLVTAIQNTTDRTGLIGSPITEDTPISIKGVISGVLETAVANGTIVAYNSLLARIRSTDPSVVEIKFAYKPAYPLNYIVISFSIDTSTGGTTINGTTTS